MTNREFILHITAKTAQERIVKILTCVDRSYTLQVAKPKDNFPTSSGLTNIIIPAKNQKNKIAVVAHHDVFPGSAGYNDNSTGVVTLLKMQSLVPDNVELVFTDGEERGGQGCRYYLENYPRPKQAINLDVIGLGTRIFYERYGKTTFALPANLKEYTNIPFSDSYTLDHYNVPNILLLTGSHPGSLIPDIFNAQHNGRDDGNIELISEATMDSVLDVVIKILRAEAAR